MAGPTRGGGRGAASMAVDGSGITRANKGIVPTNTAKGLKDTSLRNITACPPIKIEELPVISYVCTCHIKEASALV